MLKPFAANVDKVVDDLTEKGHIISAERDPARRIPGRNFSFTEKCVRSRLIALWFPTTLLILP